MSVMDIMNSYVRDRSAPVNRESLGPQHSLFKITLDYLSSLNGGLGGGVHWQLLGSIDPDYLSAGQIEEVSVMAKDLRVIASLLALAYINIKYEED